MRSAILARSIALAMLLLSGCAYHADYSQATTLMDGKPTSDCTLNSSIAACYKDSDTI